MKNKLCFMLIALIIMSTCAFLRAHAQEYTIDTCIEKQTLTGIDDNDEKDKVKDAIANSDIAELGLSLDYKEFKGIKDIDALVIGEPYKVVISNDELIAALVKGSPVVEILKELRHEWYVPLLIKKDEEYKAAAVCTIGKSDETWGLETIGGYLSSEQIDFCTKTKLNTYLKSNGIDTANFLANFEIPYLHINFIYIQSNDKEYFIPLLYTEELCGIKNMKLHTREEVTSCIEILLKSNLEEMNEFDEEVGIKEVEVLLNQKQCLPPGSYQNEITVKVNGSKIEFSDAKPYIQNGRTLIPVSAVSEALGAKVNCVDGVVTIEKGTKRIVFKVGERSAVINDSNADRRVDIDTAAVIKDDRVFLPLRFVAETLGARVNWDSL